MKREWLYRLSVLVFLFVLIGLAIKLSTVQAQQVGWPDPPYNPTNISCSTATCTLVAAPTALGECIYGLSLINAGGSADVVSIYLDGGTTAVGSVYLAASGGAATWALGTQSKNPWFITNAATAFVVKSGTTVQLYGSVYAANCP